MLGNLIEDLINLKSKREKIETAKDAQVAVILGGRLEEPIKYEILNQDLYDRHSNHLNRIDIEIQRVVQKINKITLTKT